MHEHVYLRSPAQIDTWIEAVDSSASQPEKLARIANATYVYDYDRLLSLDPFSAEYSRVVESMYTDLTKATYASSNETVDFVEGYLLRPFPYLTRSQKSVADNLIGIGAILQNIPASPPARILELGSGWGNLALILGRTGYRVDAVDIDEKSEKILSYWGKIYGIERELQTITAPFDEIDTACRPPYDVVVFFKSFHHSLSHFNLLRSCNKLLSPGGHIMFASEPIHENYPVPWGLRKDGLSVYMIRKNLWLELGFDQQYFSNLLTRTGFELSAHFKSKLMPVANVLTYRKVQTIT